MLRWISQVVGAAWLSTTMCLSLYHLPTYLGGVIRLEYRLANRLVYVHLCLDVMVVRTSWVQQSCHLDVLNLRLVDARSLSGKELLLVVGDDTIFNFTRFRCRTFWLGELLLRVLFDRLRRLINLDIAWVYRHCLLAGWLIRALLLDGHPLSLGDMLWLQHLLLEMLTVPELVLLNAQAQSLIVIVAHWQLIRTIRY